MLQDFYANNGKPQTSPFVLFDDAGLEDWNSLQYTDGNIVFYNADGKVSARAALNEGRYVGEHIQYHGNGQAFVKEQYNPESEITATTYYDEAGKPLFSFSIDSDNGDYKVDIKVPTMRQAPPTQPPKPTKTNSGRHRHHCGLDEQTCGLGSEIGSQDAPEPEALILPRMPEE